MAQRSSGKSAGRVVALKLLPDDLAHARNYREMFLAEAERSMLLTHSNIVYVFDADEDEGRLYMVMEWVDGINLSELTEVLSSSGQRMPVAVRAHIIGELLLALAYAHALRHRGRRITIVHRDVSPQNVMLSVSGEVKLMDFGIARLAAEETTGMYRKGKVRYMAPEQWRGDSRDPRIDLYAVGAIFHELLAGRKFRGDAKDVNHLEAKTARGHVDLDEIGQLPPELEVLHRSLLAYDPRDRFPSAHAALEQLRRWPGYVNSSLLVAELVRRIVGVESARVCISTSGIDDSGTRFVDEVDGDALTQVESDPSAAAPLEAGGSLRAPTLEHLAQAEQQRVRELIFADLFGEASTGGEPEPTQSREPTRTETTELRELTAWRRRRRGRVVGLTVGMSLLLVLFVGLKLNESRAADALPGIAVAQEPGREFWDILVRPEVEPEPTPTGPVVVAPIPVRTPIRAGGQQPKQVSSEAEAWASSPITVEPPAPPVAARARLKICAGNLVTAEVVVQGSSRKLSPCDEFEAHGPELEIEYCEHDCSKSSKQSYKIPLHDGGDYSVTLDGNPGKIRVTKRP